MSWTDRWNPRRLRRLWRRVRRDAFWAALTGRARVGSCTCGRRADCGTRLTFATAFGYNNIDAREPISSRHAPADRERFPYRAPAGGCSRFFGPETGEITGFRLTSRPGRRERDISPTTTTLDSTYSGAGARYGDDNNSYDDNNNMKWHGDDDDIIVAIVTTRQQYALRTTRVVRHNDTCAHRRRYIV